MKRFNFRKYSYLVLWLALILTVGTVWMFGGRALPPAEVVESAPSSGPPDFLAATAAPEAVETAAGEELRGVWVPYMSLVTEDHTQAAFEENFKALADGAKAKGINALFVHVRPFGDSLYSSAYFPWSHILTGAQGQDPGFDPLAFMVSYTHGLGMRFHAWLNPLRIRSSQTPAALAPDNPYEMLSTEYPGYFLETGEGIYLNPAYPYVRTLIAKGAQEIVENYDVDGVHFDDYFYPAGDDSMDAEAYAAYAQSVETPLPLLEWRRANISAMVQEVYAAVKAADSGVVFGIAPQGNIGNDLAMGADVEAWCAVGGYIDYICPQLYYSFENPALGFTEALSQWTALPRHPDLKLYAGLALYKAGTDADSGTWGLSDDTIARQIEAARAVECAGVVLYSSDYLNGEQTAAEMANAAVLLSP